MLSEIYKKLFTALPVPDGMFVYHIESMTIKQYKRVHRSLNCSQCPVCQEHKERGSPLCNNCKAKLNADQQYEFKNRLKWRFVGVWHDVVPRMRAEYEAARKEVKSDLKPADA